MQIDFKALEEALAPIEAIGQGELTFDAAGTAITLRVLLPTEELKAQKYAASALVDDEEGTQTTMDYIDRFRLACLSHSIVQIGDLDFRGVEYIETGEKLDSGVAIRVPKDQALRQLMSRWTRTTATAVFARFNELISRTDADAEGAIEFEPSSIPAEIDRLRKRIEDLNTKVAQTEAEEKAKFVGHVGSVAPTTKATAPTPEVVPEEPVVSPEPATHRTGPISPTVAPPPPQRPDVAPQPSTIEQPLHQPPVPQSDSSFIDVDGDGVDDALRAEHNRLIAMRRAAQQGQPLTDDASALQAIHPQTISRRMPPHLDAREVEADVGVLAAAAQKAREVGEIDGKPVFALPVQELGVKAATPHVGSQVVLDQQDPTSSKNPRFTARHKP